MNKLLLTGLALVSTCVAHAQSITSIASKSDDFKILTKALQATGLDKALASDGNFTVFAPTDAAFNRLPKGTLATLLKPENKDQLAAILKYHVVAKRLSGREVLSSEKVTTLQEGDLKISLQNASFYINDSRVVNTDIKADNGVIHVIKDVLIPELTDKKTKACITMLEEAVDSGVDLYNDGNPEACAAIYRVAVRGVLATAPSTLDKDELTVLSTALSESADQDSAKDQAWTLRKAMDKTYFNLKD